MYLARAFEHHAASISPVPPLCGNQPPQCLPVLPLLRALSAAPTQARGAVPPGANASAPAVSVCPFHHLLLAEMAKCWCQGLCFNCDEHYVHGHVCLWIFILEANDYIDDDLLGPPLWRIPWLLMPWSSPSMLWPAFMLTIPCRS
jgi:hypothetical protein